MMLTDEVFNFKIVSYPRVNGYDIYTYTTTGRIFNSKGRIFECQPWGSGLE
jgi:hypothetical protein